MTDINYQILYEAECNLNKRLMSVNKRLNSLVSAHRVHLEIFKKELEAVKNNVKSIYSLEKDEKFNAYTLRSFMTLAATRIDYNTEYNYVLVLFDLDDFKCVNDTFGHFAGDLALKSFVDTLNKSCREQIDIVGRFGGDEFILLMENITLEAASKRVREAVEKISSTPISYSHEGRTDTFNITVSAGLINYDRAVEHEHIELADSPEMVSQLSEEEINARKIYSVNFLRVDKLLYDAKQRGKNQIVSEAESLPPSDRPYKKRRGSRHFTS